jgi:hypothetical protein
MKTYFKRKVFSDKLVNPVNRTNFAMLSVWNNNGVIEIYNRFVSIVFVMKKSCANLTKCQCYNQHQRLDSMEHSFLHVIPKLGKLSRSFLTVCKIKTVGEVSPAFLFAEFVFVVGVGFAFRYRQ